MSIALDILFWILAGAGMILGLFVLLLFVPARISGQGMIEGSSASGGLDLFWGWRFFVYSVREDGTGEVRLLGIRIKRLKPKSAEERQREEEEKRIKEEKARRKAEEKAAKRRGRERGGLLKALAVWSHRRGFVMLVKRLLRTLSLTASLEGDLGTGDPAETAWLMASLHYLAAPMPRLSLDVAPRYDESVVDLNGEASLRIWPIATAFVFLVALFNREIRQALRAVR